MALAAGRVVDAGLKEAPGAVRARNRELTISLPVGFEVTFTHEKQPIGLYRHLSVSVDAEDKSPNPVQVETILKEFGMRPVLQSDRVWLEPFARGRKAVNVLQSVGDA
jgi:hypothetical protein